MKKLVISLQELSSDDQRADGLSRGRGAMYVLYDLEGEDQSEGGKTLGFWLNVGKSFLTVTRSAEVDWTASRLRAVQPFAMMLRDVLILAGHLSEVRGQVPYNLGILVLESSW